MNNVGGALPRPFLATKPHHLADAFQFNVGIAHRLTQAAVPALLATGGGAVVSIISAVGRVAGRGYLAYGTAKAALAHYTRLAAADLAPRIRVNAIAVGSVATSALDIVLTDDDLRGQMEQATPLGRIGDPEDMAAAVALPGLPGRRLHHRQDPRGGRRPRAAQPGSRPAGPVSPAQPRSARAGPVAAPGHVQHGAPAAPQPAVRAGGQPPPDLAVQPVPLPRRHVDVRRERVQ